LVPWVVVGWLAFFSSSVAFVFIIGEMVRRLEATLANNPNKIKPNPYQNPHGRADPGGKAHPAPRASRCHRHCHCHDCHCCFAAGSLDDPRPTLCLSAAVPTIRSSTRPPLVTSCPYFLAFSLAFRLLPIGSDSLHSLSIDRMISHTTAPNTDILIPLFPSSSSPALLLCRHRLGRKSLPPVATI
jgi:hypothetical protein